MNCWVWGEVSVHLVLKKNSWRVSVWFKWGITWTAALTIGSFGAEVVEAWPLLLHNPKTSDEPMLYLSVQVENSSSWIHLTNVEIRASDHLTRWFTFQLIQFNSLWVFCLFFCFQCASMSTLSSLASKLLECAYDSWHLVHGQATSVWTSLNSTVKHYKLAIQVSFISLWHLELTKSLAL
jgi:hypothetical protein